MLEVSKKVIIIGSYSVGKSSIVKRFVHNMFSDVYMTTLGVKVEKKIVTIPEATVNMIIWDIAGEVSQLQGPKAYYLGAHGVIYVFDLTRERTYRDILQDLEVVSSELPGVPISVIANKADLIPPEELELLKSELPRQPDFYVSAKTGDNVENLFAHLAKEML